MRVQMERDDALAIEEVLRSQLGSSARSRLYDRTLDSPMSFMLARAERQLHGSFSVYWVDDSAPDMFSLRGFSRPVAVFSSRYVELWADIRATLSSDITRNFIPQLTERLTLQLIAELSLSHNDPEFAASMMLRSMMTGGGLSQEPNTIATLEQEPIGTPYMAIWFYGLAHELGHFAPYGSDRSSGGVREADIVSAINATLDTWNLSEDVRAEGRAKARANPKGDILGAEHLRGEIHADIFATSVLFASTVEILKAGSFQILGFISEMMLSLNIVAVVDRCRRIAQQAVTATPLREQLVDTLLHPVSVAVRMRWVRWYLENASAQYLFGDTPSQEDYRKVSATIDSVMDHLRPAIEGAERGLAAAMTLALDRERRGSFVSVLQKWQSSANQRPGSLAIDRIAVERFCALTASLGRVSPVFTMMLETVRNPTAPLSARLESDETGLYFCPWIDGPNEFSRPFGLDTRHGHIVFVFVRDGELFKRFCDVSRDGLAEGYTIESAFVTAKTRRQLVEAITLRVPIGTQLRVVVEGTDEFQRYMSELTNGTIWAE